MDTFRIGIGPVVLISSFGAFVPGSGQQARIDSRNLRDGGVTASISGRVTDSEGRPVPNERIFLGAPVARGRYYPPINTVAGSAAIATPEQARVYDAWRRLGDLRTDDRGFYNAAGLPPGKYLVSVGEDIARASGEGTDSHDDFGNMGIVEKDIYYPMTFYRAAAGALEAGVVELAEGQHAEGIDICVGGARVARQISGRTIDGETGQPVANAKIYLTHLGPHGPISTWNPEQARSDTNGSFSIDRLIPGEFFVTAAAENDSEHYGAPVRVRVGETDVKGLEVRFQRGHSLSGELVLIEGGPPEVIQKLRALQIFARASSIGWSVERRGSPEADGTFKLTGLPPGEITLDAHGTGSDLAAFLMLRLEHPAAMPLRSIQMGDEDLGGVHLMLRYGSGTIRGKVNITRGRLGAGVQLGVSCQCSASGESRVTSASVATEGTFEFSELPPGECRLLLWYGPSKRRASADKNISLRPYSTAEVSFDLDLSTISGSK